MKTLVKWVIALVALIILNSCYKDNATFTVEVMGTQPNYLVTYTNINNVLVKNQEVERGFQYYNEYESNWRLNLKVVGVGLAKDSTIKVKVYKRESVIATFEGKQTLVISTSIVQ